MQGHFWMGKIQHKYSGQKKNILIKSRKNQNYKNLLSLTKLIKYIRINISFKNLYVNNIAYN